MTIRKAVYRHCDDSVDRETLCTDLECLASPDGESWDDTLKEHYLKQPSSLTGEGKKLEQIYDTAMKLKGLLDEVGPVGRKLLNHPFSDTEFVQFYTSILDAMKAKEAGCDSFSDQQDNAARGIIRYVALCWFEASGKTPGARSKVFLSLCEAVFKSIGMDVSGISSKSRRALEVPYDEKRDADDKVFRDMVRGAKKDRY